MRRECGRGRSKRAEVAERQTRYVQGVVSIRAWEFKSPLRHQHLNKPAGREEQVAYRWRGNALEEISASQPASFPGGHGSAAQRRKLGRPARADITCNSKHSRPARGKG